MRLRIWGHGVLLLLLGLITSTAVALALAQRSSFDGARNDWIYREYESEVPSRIYCVDRASKTGRVTFSVMFHGGFTWCFSHPDPGDPDQLVPHWLWPEIRQRSPDQDWFNAYGSGWPAICLWDAASPNEGEYFHQPLPEWCVESLGLEFLYLPRRLIWRGMALNAATYGALWGMLLYAPARVRRYRRRRTGRCLRCGYDLNGLRSSGCPECGWGHAAPPHDAGPL